MSSSFIEYFAQFRNMPKEWPEAQKFLNFYLLEMTNYLNSKTIGIYSPQETPAGKALQVGGTSFNILRKTINFGVLPLPSPKSVAHGITGIDADFRLFNLYLAASDPVGFNYFSLQYWSIAAADITLSMDSTDVTVTSVSDYSAYTECQVIIEYAKGVA